MFVFVLTIIMCALGLGLAFRATVFNGVKGVHCLAELPPRYFFGFCIGMLFYVFSMCSAMIAYTCIYP